MESHEYPELTKRSLKRINRARYKAREGKVTDVVFNYTFYPSVNVN